MKVHVQSIESTKRTVQKKDKVTGQVTGEFDIDTTQLTVAVPFSTNDEFTRAYGVKQMKYQVGETDSHRNFDKLGLDAFQSLLPCDLDIELGQGTNAWGQPVTCVTAVKLVD